MTEIFAHPSKLQCVVAKSVVDTHNADDMAAKRRKQFANFLSGGLAGTISSTLTAPLEVVKTQLQSSTIKNRLGSVTPTPASVLKSILSTDGPIGLFRGLQPLLIGIIPTRAIYFWAYSTTKASLATRFVSCSIDSPVNHLLSAFAAGITSNTIMNPLWMVKTRFQIMADTSLGQRAFSNYGEVVRA
eukprot:gene33310-44591_t